MFNEFGIMVGPIMIYWYAIIILSGAVLALVLARREAKLLKIDPDIMMDLFFVFMFAGIIGARIYFVIFQWDDFSQNLLDIFNIRAGGIAIYGGIIGAAIGGIWYCRKKKYNFFLVADIVAPVLILAQGIGRWGNFVNIEAYGGAVPGNNALEQIAYLKQYFIPDFIIERMNINGVYHHPTFLYESIVDITGFFLLYFLIRNIKDVRLGVLTLSYFVWYGIGRFFVEGMRTDSLYIFSYLRVSQIVSIIIVLVGITGLIYIYVNREIMPKYRETPFLLGTTEKE